MFTCQYQGHLVCSWWEWRRLWFLSIRLIGSGNNPPSVLSQSLTVCSPLQTVWYSWNLGTLRGKSIGKMVISLNVPVPYTTVYLSFSFLPHCWADTEPWGQGRGRGLSWSLFHAVGERFRAEPHWEWQWHSGCILSWEAQRMTYDNKGYCREKEELEPVPELSLNILAPLFLYWYWYICGPIF